jgi:D-alanyl-D-alanine carboxypeptidase (penicillin-binding protein 5/6)
MMKKFFRRLMIIAIVLFLIVTLKNKTSFPDFNLVKLSSIFNSDDYASKYIYVLNREDKSAEYEKNSREKAYPASLTKIMTTIVALEHIDDLSAVAPVDVDTYKKMVANNASMAGFYGREAVTYRDLLYGTILSSGGEAANSLAVNVAGSVDDFVILMNEKASELGLEDTHFTSPEGLQNKEQYTSAYDMARLLDYALDNGDFRAIFTKKTFTTTSTTDHPNGITLKSTVLSKLDGVPQKNFEIVGGKSGTTYEAGECWATLGVKEGCEYICIVMGAPLKDISHPDMAQKDDSIKLYERIK